MASADAQEDPSQRLRLSSEEQRVLRECNSESFYYRCLPIGLGLMGLTQYGVNKGILIGHPRFGALFKNLGAMLGGYVIGKISYQSKCREKILALPNSRLAETLRKKKSGLEFFPESMRVPESSAQQTDERLQAPGEFRPTMDIDTERRDAPKGLDDTFRPSMDRTIPVRKETNNEETTVTYDELRRKNREQQRQRSPAQSLPVPQEPSFMTSPGQPSSGIQSAPPPRRSAFGEKPQAQNQYGDVWDTDSQ